MSQNSREKRPVDVILLDDDTLSESDAKRLKREESASVEASLDTKLENSTGAAPNGPVEHIANIGGVPGLYYYPNFVTIEEERLLVEAVDTGTWDNSLKRRVQHFGLRYDYSAKSVVRNATIDPLPPFLGDVVSKLDTLGQFPSIPDQCIVNEYTPGQGINPHIDRIDSFGASVASLSLQSAVIMLFSTDSKKVEVLLEPRSMVVLTGDARFKWKHSIAPRKTDKWNGMNLQRDRRVSLTFRTVKAKEASSSSSSSSPAPKNG